MGSKDEEHAMSAKLNSYIAMIGIDIGKNSFHVVGLDRRGAIVLRQKWSRGQLETRLASIPPCLIGMEACVGAHHLSPEPPFRRAEPTTPADRAGARVDYFPAHAAFPHASEGRHLHCHFRGLLGLRPSDRSAAQRRPLSRGSDPSGYPAEPLVSYRTNRQLSGWNLPPLMVRAFGAHEA
jgi:hypothetical protein